MSGSIGQLTTTLVGMIREKPPSSRTHNGIGILSTRHGRDLTSSAGIGSQNQGSVWESGSVVARLDAPDPGPVLSECPDAYSTVTVHSGQIVILERFRGPYICVKDKYT